MATLSPSKVRTTPGCGPTPAHHDRSSPQRAALVPRSALPEPGSQEPTATSPHSTSLSAARAIQTFNSEDARDDAFLLSTEGLRRELKYDVASVISISARSACDSDDETVQGSSEASIDIITERDPVACSDVRSASPRKPLPAHWLPPSNSPTSTTTQRTRVHGVLKASPSTSPVDRKMIRATRSSIDVGKAHVDSTSFLTKEALDAVNANITSPALRRGPSKVQRSPTKVPWNSPTTSPKVGSLRHSGASPTKPSPPRITHLDTHVTADHRRATSSIVSSGATSFHTAHGSPVRSSACSQSSNSSAEDLNDTIYFHCPDYVADMDVGQIDDSSSKEKASSMTTTKASLQLRTSRPELWIRIPPSDTASDAGLGSASTLDSATSSTAVSVGRGSSPGHDHLESHHGMSTQSRIPRMSISKGSSARAPTLSSTLKQTKSTQTLRSPKATKSKIASKSTTASKATGTKSLRNVRTVDSTGSTPILSNRRSRDFSIPASVASVAAKTTERTTHPSNVGLLTSYLQDTALRALEPAESLPASSTTSRATSTSTVKASQTINDPPSSDSASTRSHKGQNVSGNVHSSDADDEYDDSSMSAPVRGRSAQYNPSARRTTISEVSIQSSSASDLRATATEFVPILKDTSENIADHQPLPSLPDMYALDGYGIPWFYHMYPMPWIFWPMYTKGRSKSPKKLRPKKPRSTINSAATDQEERLEAFSSTQTGTAPSVADLTISTLDRAGRSDAAPHHQDPAAASDHIPATRTMPYVKASDGPFSTQLDMIARQTALQAKTNTVQLPKVDLTTIRNVPAQDELLQGHTQGYNGVPSRRWDHRQIGNGLYGGRGNVGVPLYATAPFPIPVPPMGRPVEQPGGHNTYVGYTIGTQGCGTIEIERAAEHGGGLACNSCEPDH